MKPGQPRPSGGSGPRPGGGSGTGPKTVRTVALVAAGLVLIGAGVAGPAPAAEPLQLRWRPATEQERQAYDARRLAELLDELRQQHTQTPAITPEPAPTFASSVGAGHNHPFSRAGEPADARPAAHTNLPGVRGGSRGRRIATPLRQATPVGSAEVPPVVGPAGP